MDYLLDLIAKEQEDDGLEGTTSDADEDILPNIERRSQASKRDDSGDLHNDASDDELYAPKSMSAPPASGGGLVASVSSGIGGLFRAISMMVFPTQQDNETQPPSFNIAFGEIRQLSWLGVGAHGCVFLGMYRGRTVAVKKFKELEMTQKEVKHLQQLDHENIIKFIGVCIEPPTFALVMEAATESLHDIVHKTSTPIPPRLVLLYSSHVCSGMHYLHQKGIIHRDLKSPNILRTGDLLKISDFGTCKEFRGRSMNMSFIGTVAWMAPEVIRNEPCSEKVDVWSFGVVLWELLTRAVPYEGVDAGAIVWGVGSNSLTLPIPSSAPDGFTLLLQQCWNKVPRNRPAFRQTQLHLEILSDDNQFGVLTDEAYLETQRLWHAEVTQTFETLQKQDSRDIADHNPDTGDADEAEIKQASRIDRIRQHYERNLEECRQERQLLEEKARELKRREEELARKEEQLRLATSPKKLIIKENILARTKAMEDFFVRKHRASEDENIDEDNGREVNQESQ